MEEHEVAQLLADMALAPVSHVRSLLACIEVEEKEIEDLSERILDKRRVIAGMKGRIREMTELGEAVFSRLREPSEDTYLEELRKVSLLRKLSFDPLYAREQYALFRQRPLHMPESTHLTAFAIRPNNDIVISESRRAPTIMTVGDDAVTLANVEAPASSFLATASAIYALGARLAYCKFSDGVQVLVPEGVYAFSEDDVYRAEGRSIHKLFSEQAVMSNDRVIKAFAVHGDKVALLCDRQYCSLYTLPDVTEVAAFQSSGASSVGICGGKLVTAGRKTIHIHDGATVYKHTLDEGQDRPMIVNGPRCIVQTRQGNLYEFKEDKKLFISSCASHAVYHNGLLYYIYNGRLTLANFRFLA